MTALRGALLAAASLFLSSAALADGADGSADMTVEFDQSAVLTLDRAAKTVVVGNAAIADAQLVNDHTIYVLGRMFGQTNIIAIDERGAEISNTRVNVSSPGTAIVTLYRGSQFQRNLACAPRCERTLTQGDTEFQDMYQDHDKKVDVSEKSTKLASGK